MLDQAVPKPSRTGWADTVFLALLEHLYTDSVEIDHELALPLFAAADFLGVDHLKAKTCLTD